VVALPLDFGDGGDAPMVGDRQEAMGRSGACSAVEWERKGRRGKNGDGGARWLL
jgi:hypothetical protein